jgi:hypothetical protein
MRPEIYRPSRLPLRCSNRKEHRMGRPSEEAVDRAAERLARLAEGGLAGWHVLMRGDESRTLRAVQDDMADRLRTLRRSRGSYPAAIGVRVAGRAGRRLPRRDRERDLQPRRCDGSHVARVVRARERGRHDRADEASGDGRLVLVRRTRAQVARADRRRVAALERGGGELMTSLAERIYEILSSDDYIIVRDHLLDNEALKSAAEESDPESAAHVAVAVRLHGWARLRVHAT